MTRADMYINRNESVCSSLKVHVLQFLTFHRNGETFPWLSSKDLCISMGKTAPKASQSMQVGHRGAVSSAFGHLQEVCKVISLGPKWLCSANTGLTCVIPVVLGTDTMRRATQATSPQQKLCRLGNSCWAYRIIATLIWAPCPDHL